MYPEEIPLLLKRIAQRRKERALEQITQWAMLLDIAVAAASHNPGAVRQINHELQQMRRRIEMGGAETRDADLEFHRKLIDLNRRRRESRKVV